MKTLALAILIFLSAITSYFNCNKQTEFIEIIGTWYYIQSENIYTEVYIDSTNILFYSDSIGWMGPYKYSFMHNSLEFHSTKYKVERMECNKLLLSNSDFIFEIRRIDCKAKNRYFTDKNPYYIRKYNYLVNYELISVSEAIEYLNSIELDKIDEYEEELLFSRDN